MVQETKTVTLRIPLDTAEFVVNRSEGCGMTQGVKNIVEKLQELERYADLSVKGVFTPEEWSALADSLNGTMITDQFRYRSDALVAHMEDSQTYENVCTKWNIDLPTITAKINSLTPIQVDALYRRVEKFWEYPDTDLNEWSKY